MLLQLAGLGLLGLDLAYHRWLAPKPPPSKINAQAVTLPRTDLGGPVPIVFGWTNVKSPFLAFANVPKTITKTDPDTGDDEYRTYAVDMAFVCGIPMGSGVTRGNRLAGPKLVNVWYGDKALPKPLTPLPSLDGATTWDAQRVIRDNWNGGPGSGGGLHGTYYWFGGWTDQRFDFPTTHIGDAMASSALAARSDAQMFGGLPNQMVVAFAMFGGAAEGISVRDDTQLSTGVVIPPSGFSFGESPNINGISVEVQTYGDRVNDVTEQHIFAMQNEGVDFGGDADPIECIYDLLVGGVFGKMGLDASLTDLVSFGAASATLKNENHGYSRSFEERQPAAEMIKDILRQIDAALDIDPATGKLVIQLIRNDYDPTLIPHITMANGCRLENVKLIGPSGVPNKLTVTYPDRSKGYAVVPATAQNLANAVGQDGLVVESTLHFEGIKRNDLATAIAKRELGATSRPLITCTAYLDGSFRYLKRGDPVMVTWSKPDIAGLVFRVADVNRGTLIDGKIQMQLIQDYFYVWRNRPPLTVDVGGHDATGLDGISRA